MEDRQHSCDTLPDWLVDEAVYRCAYFRTRATRAPQSHAALSLYLPDYPRDIADAVTIRKLLGHSAGVPDFARRPDIMQIVKEPATPQEVISKYCNCGYLILGALYERVTGDTSADGLRRLTARAGLADTDISGPRAIVPRSATAYLDENGQQIKAPYIDWSVAFFWQATTTRNRQLTARICCLPHTRATSPGFTAA
jgi:CubicO group peptidase (beta-lactamase class C family)